MKREIFCMPCSLKLGRINPIAQVSALDAAMAAQEQVIKCIGKSKGSHVCDFCGTAINPGDSVVAQTIVPMGQNYFPWENDYIDVATVQSRIRSTPQQS